MRYFMLSASVLSLLLNTAAFAEGGSEAALSYSWTGLYGGIHGAYGWQHSNWDFGAAGSTSHDDSNGAVGAQVGYGGQVGDNFFIGLEASIDATDINGKSACFSGQICKTHVDSLGDLSGRLGVTSGRALYYVKGGVAYEEAVHSIKSPGVNNNDDGNAVFGYLAGGGVEYALAYNVTTKLEYDYMDFGDKETTISPATRVNVKEPISLVKLGFNLKFD